MGGVRGTRGLVLVGLLAAALLSPAAADAAFPGQNGKIAFDAPRDGDSEVYSMNPDGLAQTQLTTNAAHDRDPAWSADGSKIAFASDRDGNYEIYVMNANGTGQTRLTNSATLDAGPTWSPDGARIAFVRDTDIYVMNADGTNQTSLIAGATEDSSPAWSPDGLKIAFERYEIGALPAAQVYVANADGSGPVSVTPYTEGQLESGENIDPTWSPSGHRIAFAHDTCEGSCDPKPLFNTYTVAPDGSGLQYLSGGGREPAWSPDGTKIAFDYCHPAIFAECDHVDVATMNASGGSTANLTNDQLGDSPDWQPLPYTGYARPKGATPIRASLVIAYKQCQPSNINRVHGPSLEFSSCAPPVEESDWVTTGTADANSQATQFVGSLRFDTLAGNLATPADEADLRIVMDITDVRRKSDLTDYAGQVQANTTLRITDRFNASGPGGGSDPATVVDIPLPVNAGCSATADPAVGSTCATVTTFEAIVPGAVREGKRSIWEIGQVQVYDGGSDGATSTHPNTLFARQGIFVP